MKLSVVIPAHNEAESLRSTLALTAAALDAAVIEYELLVVDDSSTDASAEVVATLEGVIHFANPAAEQLFGRSSRELIGTQSAFHPSPASARK